MADLTFDTQEAVPEDLRDSAEAKDGKFVVSVGPAKKITEFRDNNLNLSRERDTLAGTIAKLRTDVGFDPEKYDDFTKELTDLRTVAQQVADGKLIKDTSLDEAVSKKTGEMQRQHQAQLESVTTVKNNLETENRDLKQRLDNMEIDTEVGNAASLDTSGIRPDAIAAVKREGREVFKLKDGKLVPTDRNGDTIYGADGTSPMTPLEWIKTKLSVSAPYLFKESSGGGAGGGKGNQNLGDISKLPPAERMRLARQAG